MAIHHQLIASTLDSNFSQRRHLAALAYSRATFPNLPHLQTTRRCRLDVEGSWSANVFLGDQQLHCQQAKAGRRASCREGQTTRCCDVCVQAPSARQPPVVFPCDEFEGQLQAAAEGALTRRHLLYPLATH